MYVLTINNCMIKIIKIDQLNVKVKSINACYLIDPAKNRNIRGQVLSFRLSAFKEFIWKNVRINF